MAAEVGVFSGLKLSTKPFLHPFQPTGIFSSTKIRRLSEFKISANLGEGEGELKKSGKKKFITKDEEPTQYWLIAGEREGENPMKTPIPYIIIFGFNIMREVGNYGAQNHDSDFLYFLHIERHG